MTRWRWALLIFELFLFALILILPQVDLPDFTFHGGTAPVVAKARVSPAPLRAIAAPTQIPVPNHSLEGVLETMAVATFTCSDSRLSLLCMLIC